MFELYTLRIFDATETLVHEQRFELRQDFLHPVGDQVQTIYQKPMVMLLCEFETYFKHNCNFSRIELVPESFDVDTTLDAEWFIGITQTLGLLNIRHLDKSKPAFRLQSQKLRIQGVECYCLRLLMSDLPFRVLSRRPIDQTLEDACRRLDIMSKHVHDLHLASKKTGPCPCVNCRNKKDTEDDIVSLAPEEEEGVAEKEPEPEKEPVPESEPEPAPAPSPVPWYEETHMSAKRVLSMLGDADESPIKRVRERIMAVQDTIRRVNHDPYRWVSLCLTVLPWSPFCISTPIFDKNSELAGFALPLQWFNHVFVRLSKRTTRLGMREIATMFNTPFPDSSLLSDRFRSAYPSKFRPKGVSNVILFQKQHVETIRDWYTHNKEMVLLPFSVVDELDPCLWKSQQPTDQLFDAYLKGVIIHRRCRVHSVMDWEDLASHFKQQMDIANPSPRFDATAEVHRMLKFATIFPDDCVLKSSGFTFPPINMFPSDMILPIQTTFAFHEKQIREIASRGLMELSLQAVQHQT